LGKNHVKRKDKTYYFVEGFYTKKIVERILPHISKTFITPNMVTILNSIFGIFAFWLAYRNQYIAVAVFMQVYLFLDILDGNLARYKDMKSDFGAKLDNINDRFFYTLIFVFIGIHELPWKLILILALSINFYAVITTFYIVPRLRKLDNIRRRKVKGYFMNRGYILGMDLSMMDLLTTLFLIVGQVRLLFIILIISWDLDLIMRLSELWWNERLQKINSK